MADLPPLAPASWRRKLAKDLEADVVEYLAEAEDWGVIPEVRSVRIRPSVAILRCQGAQAFHVDIEFPRFTHLLILQSDGYMVEGGMWREPFKADAPGTVICLDTHIFHALRTPDQDGPEQLQEAVTYAEPYPRAWAAIALEGWVALTPSQAREAFHNALTFDAERLYAEINRSQL
jgi:hypothetical protein